jgi:CBS domain containing-hemolysin-like protein
MLVGNNIVLVVYSLCMSLLLRSVFTLFGWDELASQGSVLVETVVSTVLIIFVGEFLPKSIVKNNPNFYYRTFAPLIYFFYILLYPVARLTTLLSQGILRLLGRKVEAQPSLRHFNHDDLAALLDANSEVPAEEENELKIFQNALDFADQRVRDCMIPRIDVEAVDIDETSIEELTARFVESKYSRLFVYRQNIDNIIGYVNSKSLFTAPKSIEAVMMQVHYVPETMPLQALLENFTKHRASIAVVIDEFGGTAGIISLEDVLEQIFGEIEDEHDRPDMVEKRISEREFVFSCRLEVEYLNEKYDIAIPESDEYDTLAGYIISRYEELPTAGTVMEFDGLRVKILKTTRSRIELARVERVGKSREER